MHSPSATSPTGGAEARRVVTQPALHDDLMERIVDRANMRRAWKRVKANKGAPGGDGMTLEDFPTFACSHWSAVRQDLLDGTYQPQPVRRVSIPKPNGGERWLGIPNVVDRVIQQAIGQVLTPIFDPGFSESSFGFRLGTLCPWSSPAGTTVYRRGLSVRRGPGLGAILRPSQPRCADGPRGQEGEG
jgi:RNA-directed DNA polymerase